MFNRFFATAAALAASSVAPAQGVATVDLLNPSETTGTIPANTRIVDIFFDVVPTDVWTAAGIRALTESEATIIYFDTDQNTPKIGLFDGGVANKFTTMLSKPRNRDAAERFTNGGVAAAGTYDPGNGAPATLPNQLNVAYFASPPETPQSPSVDGYIARIAVDISNVPPIPGWDINDYNNWGAGRLGNVPSGSLVVLRSIGANQQGGTATATFDVAALNFSNWAMWYVPEPTSLALLAVGGLAGIRRR